MAEVTRRSALIAGAGVVGALAAPRPLRAAPADGTADVIVIGAGVFGAWTATKLQAAGQRVLLIDAWAPAHARASSGGESRMTRGAYGSDAIYTRMAWESLADWKALSARAALPLFHEAGVLFFFPRVEPYVEETLRVHEQLGLPTEHLDNAALRRRFPMIDFEGVEVGLFEPRFGALMARRAVETVVAEFVAKGGRYQQAAIMPPRAASERLDGIETADGKRFSAGRYVFACGSLAAETVSLPPWLTHLPDPSGGVLLCAGGGRRPLHSWPIAWLG